MGVQTKPGARFRSVVCNAELIVVRPAKEIVDLRCGGHPVLVVDEQPPAGLSVKVGFDGGSAVGKRYVDEETGLEVLCTKPGTGALSVGETPLQLKQAKPLPSSD
jgi:hypothetical protein